MYYPYDMVNFTSTILDGTVKLQFNDILNENLLKKLCYKTYNTFLIIQKLNFKSIDLEHMFFSFLFSPCSSVFFFIYPFFSSLFLICYFILFFLALLYLYVFFSYPYYVLLYYISPPSFFLDVRTMLLYIIYSRFLYHLQGTCYSPFCSYFSSCSYYILFYYLISL